MNSTQKIYKKLTFTVVVRYTSEMTYDDFMKDLYGTSKRYITKEEKDKVWLELCKQSDLGEFEEDDVVEEEDDDDAWTGNAQQEKVQSVIDELIKDE